MSERKAAAAAGKGAVKRSSKKQQEEEAEEEEDSSSSSEDEFVEPEDSEASEDESEDEEGTGEQVNVEFTALPPAKDDFWGMKTLLAMPFAKTDSINYGDLADLILEQPYVASVIKVVPGEGEEEEEEEEEEKEEKDGDKAGASSEPVPEVEDYQYNIYGLTTVVNLKEHKNNSGVKGVVAWLTNQCKNAEIKAKFTEALQKPNVGIIFCDRFSNIPPQLAGPMYKTLLDDMSKATADGKKFKFDSFVFVSKTYTVSQAENPKKKKAKLEGKQKQPAAAAQRYFVNEEEEIFYKKAELKYDTRVEVPDGDSEEGVDVFRSVLLISAEKFKAAVNQICSQYAAPYGN